MVIPEAYPDALTDEVAPYGFEFTSMTADEDGITSVLFEAEPESFARAHRDVGIEDSYGSRWPPPSLQLWLRFDAGGDPIQIEFEVFDLLAWSASADPALHARLNSMEDPFDHAVAVGQALSELLQEDQSPTDDYLE